MTTNDQEQLLKSLFQLNNNRISGNYEAAILICEELMVKYGFKEYLSSVIANCYFILASTKNLGSEEYYDKAIVWGLRAIELAPDNANFHANLAEYYWLGFLDYEKATSEYKKAININPNHISALLGLASLYGPPDSDVTIYEAIECLERVNILVPDNNEYHGRLGQLYLDMGKLEEAEQEWVIALTTDKPLDVGFEEIIKEYLSK